MKLNLGAGEKQIDGYTNFDIKNGQSIYPLDLPDGHCDELRASHVLEHFKDSELSSVLAEWVRVLKPGGWLKIAVPDFDWIVQEYTNGNKDGLPLASFLLGGQQDDYDYHKAIFSCDRLDYMLRQAGLQRIERWESEINDCASYPLSLNLMGRKCFPKAQARIVAAMSVPRYGPLATQFAVNRLAMTGGILTSYGWGVFWHHSLTRSVEKCLEWTTPEGHEADYILTIDYDSLFNVKHVGRLAAYLHDNPEVNAVVPLQAKRNRGGLLAGTKEGQVADIRSELIPISTGHFGLTLFRREVFEKLSKPWFWERPDADGRWQDGRVDADIGFWKSLEEAGMSAMLATRVTIGHIEEVATWPRLMPDNKVEHVYQKLDDWLQTDNGPLEDV